jgi:Trypsin
VLIAPSVVLTAAHCLYNPRTRALLQPVSLHVLFGFEQDSYRRHLRVARYRLGPGFMPGLWQPQPGDWALLTLAESVPTQPLPLYTGPLAPGMRVMLAGYNQDRSQLLLADPDCHVRGKGAGRRRQVSRARLPGHLRDQRRAIARAAGRKLDACRHQYRRRSSGESGADACRDNDAGTCYFPRQSISPGCPTLITELTRKPLTQGDSRMPESEGYQTFASSRSEHECAAVG